MYFTEAWWRAKIRNGSLQNPKSTAEHQSTGADTTNVSSTWPKHLAIKVLTSQLRTRKQEAEIPFIGPNSNQL
jgi:hypothetical protein